MYLSTDHVYGDIFLSPSFLLSIMVSFPFQVPLLLIYNFALMNMYSSLVTQASFTLVWIHARKHAFISVCEGWLRPIC